ncbi:MAG: hypothetical protein EOM40_04305 [Clostridia bacterium]|nr:hypothetical protein [Clostridia bacterium]NCC43895.1 hypothetical protein [Clostridia bacterium]
MNKIIMITLIVISFLLMISVPIVFLLLTKKVYKKSLSSKHEQYSGTTVGVIYKIQYGGFDVNTIFYVSYKVNGIDYKIKETAKLKSEAIRIGSIPIGQMKTYILGPVKVGSQVTVCYDISSPEKAFIQGNRTMTNQ